MTRVRPHSGRRKRQGGPAPRIVYTGPAVVSRACFPIAAAMEPRRGNAGRLPIFFSCAFFRLRDKIPKVPGSSPYCQLRMPHLARWFQRVARQLKWLKTSSQRLSARTSCSSGSDAALVTSPAKRRELAHARCAATERMAAHRETLGRDLEMCMHVAAPWRARRGRNIAAST